MPLQLDINQEFRQALDIIENTGRHLFITGKAGTGKSTLLDYCRRNSQKNLVLLAPTGVAALNIKGQTIHRFFGFPINISVEKIISRQFLPRAKRIYKNLETLVIDEVSMLRADLLDCIDAFLRLYGPAPELPFGGVQMVFVGDLYQLPPVISAQEQSFFAEKYASPYFFSAEVFRSIPLEVIELKKIYRQKDRDFIELLSRFRSNSITDADIEKLNSRLNQKQELTDFQDFQIWLTATNKQADNINQRRLEALEGILYASDAVIDGTFSQDFYPAGDVLYFKIGAQIMFLNNDSKNRWVNGSLGYIEKIKLDNGRVKHISVRLHQDHRLVEVFPYSWEIYKYTLEGKEIISEVIGSFTQFPFRPAWAVTIHKSQGKTFDNVILDIGRGTFAAGQLYVALSRCTSFEGLSLSQPVERRHVMTDYRIFDFMSRYCPQELSAVNRFKLLEEAISKRRKLEISYVKLDGEKSRRIIIPLHIKSPNLLAFCTQRGQQRSFALDRIASISPYEED